MPSTKPIVIMGAGPAGLTAAWQLIRAGREVVVWEADPTYVGGLSRTVEANGFRFDIGGHRFVSKSQEVNEVWRQIMPKDFSERPHQSRIYYKGKFFNYPPETMDIFKKLGAMEAFHILRSSWRSRFNPIKPEVSFAHWATNRYGKRLFDLFFKSYAEKVLGFSCDEISPEEGRKAAPAIEPRVGSFLYPREGPGQLWATAAHKIWEQGAVVFIDRKVQTIHWDETGVTHITGTNRAGEFFQQEGSHFLSSIPLPELLLSLDPPPPKEIQAAARALRYRELLTVCLIVNRADVFPDTWIDIHDPEVKVSRVQNYKNWSAAMVPDPKMSSLGLEYFCFADDNVWKSTDHDLARLAIREAEQIGLIRPDEVKDAFVVRTPKASPVYDQNYQASLKTIKDWVCLFANLQPLGRNGMHQATNQDHAMMTAILAVKNIQGGEYDCWKVNADAEYPESPGANGNRNFKVVFRLKKESPPQEEIITAKDENEARKWVQAKHGVATYLIVSITETKTETKS